MDAFRGVADAVFAPATWGRAVVPDDGVALGEVPKALYVGSGGTLVVRGADGGDVTFKGLASGSVLPFRARFVRATGTTAADIVALY